MNAFLELFKKKQEPTEPQQQQPVNQQELLRQQVETQQAQLELQQHQYEEANPDYAYQRDAAKYLTADNLLDKKGLPVLDGEEIVGFVPKEVIDYQQGRAINPQLNQLQESNQALLREAQSNLFKTETVPAFEKALKENFSHITGNDPTIDYGELLIQYTKLITDQRHIFDPNNPQNGGFNLETSNGQTLALQLALANYQLANNVEASKRRFAEGDGGDVSPLASIQNGQVVSPNLDDIPDVEFIVHPNSELFNKMDTPQNAALVEFANTRMQINSRLREKTGKRAIVEHGTMDELERLRRDKPQLKVRILQDLVSNY